MFNSPQNPLKTQVSISPRVGVSLCGNYQPLGKVIENGRY
jgi:hypothetical protein